MALLLPCPKDFDVHQKLLYAHRGAALEHPENTLGSFELALDIGATALEMDVHLSSDGFVVVSHDAEAIRTCGVSRNISESTLSEIKSWDAGFGFTDARGEHTFRGTGVTIPTLGEVLEACPNVPINVDVKAPQPKVVDTVIQLVRRRNAESRVRLATFNFKNWFDLRRRYPRSMMALNHVEVVGAAALPRVMKIIACLGGAAQIPRTVGRLRLDTEGMIRRFHRAGLRVDFWTINDVASAKTLLERGADGIMTDDPRKLIGLFS